MDKEPMWPVTDLEVWKKECLEATKLADETEKAVIQAKKDKVRFDEEEVQEKEARGIARQKKISDQRSERMRTIRASQTGLQKIDSGGNTMGKKQTTETQEAPVKAPTLTGTIDSLLRADLDGSYAEGGVSRIVETVNAQFPDLDAKRIKGLVFSRRASARKASLTPAAA